jgi:hypothetical protein
MENHTSGEWITFRLTRAETECELLTIDRVLGSKEGSSETQ